MMTNLVVDVEDSLLNFVVDFSGCVDEGFLHVGGSLGRSLHEDETVLARERLAFLPLDITPSFEITGKGKVNNSVKKSQRLR